LYLLINIPKLILVFSLVMELIMEEVRKEKQEWIKKGKKKSEADLIIYDFMKEYKNADWERVRVEFREHFKKQHFIYHLEEQETRYKATKNKAHLEVIDLLKYIINCDNTIMLDAYLSYI